MTQPNDQVTSLPGAPEITNTQFSGYTSTQINSQSDDAEKLFYWFVGTEDYANQPTILWTNGGPGSSSFWGFFLENGPYTIETAIGDYPVVRPNPTGWNNFANYMIFEHPLDVTLSFAKNLDDVPKDPTEGAKQWYAALLNFLDLHPEIACNKIILAGESFAGTYLPLLANQIVQGNAAGNRHIDIGSIVLCDAWVDPDTQMATDTTYAHTHGLISLAEKTDLDQQVNDGTLELSGVNAAIQSICGCYMANTAEIGDPPFDPVLLYLNRADVRKEIHVASTAALTNTWSQQVSDNYQNSVNDSCLPTVQHLLDQGIKIQVVSGLNDAKDCNFLGTEAWLSKLKGPAANAFKQQQTTQWLDDIDVVIGFYQDGGHLSWLKVLNAGHLAVNDQPLIIDVILDKAMGGFNEG